MAIARAAESGRGRRRDRRVRRKRRQAHRLIDLVGIVDSVPFDDQAPSSNCMDVLGWIALDQVEIRALSPLDGSHLVVQAEEARAASARIGANESAMIATQETKEHEGDPHEGERHDGDRHEGEHHEGEHPE
jgi:hypothetical protein